jgi:F0F1-type ATP synthase membrane subunit b/b'
MARRGGISSIITRARKEAARPKKTPKEQARQKYERKKKKPSQEGQ